MDDVILDLCGGLQTSLHMEWGVDVPLIDLMDKEATLPDGRKIFGPEVLGYYADEESWLRDRDYVWATFPVIPGALGTLRHLRNQGDYVEIVTAKPQWAEWVTWKWLGRWKPPVHRVTIVPLGGNKSEATDADILVDDSLSNVQTWLDSGRDAIIFDRPWNRAKARTKNVKSKGRTVLRAHDWHDIRKYADHFRKLQLERNSA